MHPYKLNVQKPPTAGAKLVTRLRLGNPSKVAMSGCKIGIILGLSVSFSNSWHVIEDLSE